MTHDLTPASKATKWVIESLGYRVCVACNDGKWICTAKNDVAGDFHVVRADTEATAIAGLAESVGVELEDG